MADIVYGINRAQTKDQVTVGAVDPGTDIYVTIDDTKGLRKQEIMQQLEVISQQIFEQPDHN